MKKTNAIYGDGKERPEVVTVIGGSDFVQRELFRTARNSGHCMIPEVQPSWLGDLAKITIEPLKQKEGLADLRGNGFGTWRDHKKKVIYENRRTSKRS